MKVIQATYPRLAASRYQGRFRGKVFRFYNAICPVVAEYDEKTDWVEDLQSLDNFYNEFLGFFTDNGISNNTLFIGLSSTGLIDGKSYGSSQYVHLNHLKFRIYCPEGFNLEYPDAEEILRAELLTGTPQLAKLKLEIEFLPIAELPIFAQSEES